MTLAAATRDAVDDHPFLRRALRAGVVNHAAAARFLDVDGDQEAVSAAVRRYGEDLAEYDAESRDAPVSMKSGVGPAEDGLLSVSGQGYGPGQGSMTALVATGDVDTRALSSALERLHTAGVEPDAAGVADDSLVVVVERRDGANALRIVEDALDALPANTE
ncbi:DUF7523 family protein [Halobacterium zhouii]|uniref:DUF7523 family protein n=1 Tax=Halobacterium zhouii TaxID=2902624 RepID=UPI001E551939|nr:hypothetical protein [Halobacterium zhouii]